MRRKAEFAPDRWSRDLLFAAAAVVCALVLAGVAGYGNLASTLPGLVGVALAGYLGVRVGRAVG